MKKIKSDPNSSYKKRLIEQLQKLEREQATSQECIPCIHGMPKIHKQGISLGLLVNSINSVIYSISKYLAYILAAMVGNTPYRWTLSTARGDHGIL